MSERPPPAGSPVGDLPRRRAARRQPPRWAERVARVSLGACGALCGVMTLSVLAPLVFPPALRWLEGLTCLAAGWTAWAILLRRLPLQNMVGGSLMLVGLPALVSALSARTGVPLGEIEYTDALGPLILGLVPISLPALWMALLLSGRETARVILRPWRRQKLYGYYLLSTASLLLVVAALMLDPFAVVARGWWSWSRFSGASWYGAPWGSFIVWLFAAAFTLTVATPWLLPKRPIPSAPSLQAPALWLMLSLWFTSGNLRQGLWGAGVGGLVVMAAVSVLAWRGRQAGQAAVTGSDVASAADE